MSDENVKHVEIKDELEKEKKKRKKKIEYDEALEEKTTADLIASGELIRAEDLQKIIDDELEKRAAEQKANPKKFDDVRLIGTYKQLTSLTDEDFIKRLIQWHVSTELAKILFDHHATFDKKKLWQFLRDNYRPNKKRH